MDDVRWSLTWTRSQGRADQLWYTLKQGYIVVKVVFYDVQRVDTVIHMCTHVTHIYILSEDTVKEFTCGYMYLLCIVILAVTRMYVMYTFINGHIFYFVLVVLGDKQLRIGY